MSKHYYQLYCADKKVETSCLAKPRFELLRTKPLTPITVLSTCLHLGEQTSHVLNREGYYFTLGR